MDLERKDFSIKRAHRFWKDEQGSRSKLRRSHLPHPTSSLWFSGIWTGQVFLISHPSPIYTIFLEASLGPRASLGLYFISEVLRVNCSEPRWPGSMGHLCSLGNDSYVFSRPHKGNCFRAELHASWVKMWRHHSVSGPSWSAFTWYRPKTKSVQIYDSLDSCCFSLSRVWLSVTPGTIAH